MTVGSAAALLWLVGNDVTIVGVADDAAIPAAVGTLLEGLKLCLG